MSVLKFNQSQWLKHKKEQNEKKMETKMEN